MLERRIFGEGEDRREVHIWHGASETMYVYDSEGILTDWSGEKNKKFKRVSSDPYEHLEREILGE